MIIKKVKDNWINEFGDRLDKQEVKQFKKVRQHYKREYFKAIERFLQTRKTTGFEGIFKPSDFNNIYRDIYRDVGLSFATWYSQNAERLTKKQDVSGYKDTWEATFAAEGERIAGKRVTLVQGTAKATLTKELTRFMKNPDFMNLNEREASRVLRSRFDKYSNSQAKRLVRTEATNAANLGTMRSALDIFGADSLQKEWIAALDERVRSVHAEANGQVVAFNEKFKVGGELLDRAGDPAGSPWNVINCRCSIAPFPKEGAEAISEIDSIDFDLAQQAFDSSTFELTSRTVAPVVADVVYEFLPSNWDEVAFPETDKEILKYLKKPVNVNKAPMVYSRRYGRKIEDGSFFRKSTRQIQISNKRYSEPINRQKIIAHEFGHAINKDLNFVGYRYTNDVNSRYEVIVNPLIKKMFDKHRKMIGITPSGNLSKKGKDLFKKFGGGKTAKVSERNWENNYYPYREKLRSQFPELSEQELNESLGGVSDYLCALSDNKIGFGHDWKGYFEWKHLQYEEVMAHSYENKFARNIVFQKLFPEMHADTIKLLDELLKDVKNEFIDALERILKSIS
jgi:hypothetical protein